MTTPTNDPPLDRGSEGCFLLLALVVMCIVLFFLG
jgi:hypothetical protein